MDRLHNLGSTYFAIAKVIESMPPLLSMGIRFTLAGLILFTFIYFRQGAREFQIPRPEIASASILGFVRSVLELEMSQ